MIGPHNQMVINNKSKRPCHPPTSEMVLQAIRQSNQRRGVSLQAVKKYIQQNYKVDIKNIKVHLHKFLKASLASGSIIRTSGRGVLGSFKIGRKVENKRLVTVRSPAPRGRFPPIKKKPLLNKSNTSCSSLKVDKKTSSVVLKSKSEVEVSPIRSEVSRTETSDSTYELSGSMSAASSLVPESVSGSVRQTRAAAKRIL